MWTLHDGFKDFVCLQWSTSGFSPIPLVQFELKIQNLVLALKWWNIKVFGNIQQNLKNIEDKFIYSGESYSRKLDIRRESRT